MKGTPSTKTQPSRKAKRFSDATLARKENERQESDPEGSIAKFIYFTKLPTEIRFAIWGYVTTPALLMVSTDKRRRDPCRIKRRAVQYPVPVLLQTCRESRNELLFQQGVDKCHPTYHIIKLQSSDKGLQSTVFFSPELDLVIFKDMDSPANLFASRFHNHDDGM